jgi:hypothetical protein
VAGYTLCVCFQCKIMMGSGALAPARLAFCIASTWPSVSIAAIRPLAGAVLLGFRIAFSFLLGIPRMTHDGFRVNMPSWR